MPKFLRHVVYLQICILFGCGSAADDLAAEYGDLDAYLQQCIDKSDAATRARLIAEGIGIAKAHPGNLPLCLGLVPQDTRAGCALTNIEGMRLAAALCDVVNAPPAAAEVVAVASAAPRQRILPPSGPSAPAACGRCADVGGVGDVLNLCVPVSWGHWGALKTAVCDTWCSAECGSDWCARLADPAYDNASDECNACAVSYAISELLDCDAE